MLDPQKVIRQDVLVTFMVCRLFSHVGVVCTANDVKAELK